MNIFSVDNEKKIQTQLKFMVIKLFTLDNFKHNIFSQHSIKFYINKNKVTFLYTGNNNNSGNHKDLYDTCEIYKLLEMTIMV